MSISLKGLKRRKCKEADAHLSLGPLRRCLGHQTQRPESGAEWLELLSPGGRRAAHGLMSSQVRCSASVASGCHTARQRRDGHGCNTQLEARLNGAIQFLRETSREEEEEMKED